MKLLFKYIRFYLREGTAVAKSRIKSMKKHFHTSVNSKFYSTSWSVADWLWYWTTSTLSMKGKPKFFFVKKIRPH